jgi:hypothetical protein
MPFHRLAQALEDLLSQHRSPIIIPYLVRNFMIANALDDSPLTFYP